jgi:hypothetical protein
VASIDRREIEATIILYPTGKHEVPYWKSHVEEYLDFYGQLWPKSEGELPPR